MGSMEGLHHGEHPVPELLSGDSDVVAEASAGEEMQWRGNASENAKWPWPLPREFLFVGAAALENPVAVHRGHGGRGHGGLH
jgi:hypothetical protein